MNQTQITEAVETINRIERQLIAGMSETEYRAYIAIPEDDRKLMLFAAYQAANA